MAGRILRTRITKAAVDAMLPGDTLRDVDLKGFGARRQQGAASYFMQRKIRGRLRWVTIGPHGNPWTPQTARAEALRLLAVISQGEDPHLQKRIDREQSSVREVAAAFMASHGPKLKPRTREEYQRLINLHVAPALGSLLVADVRKVDIARLHAAMAATPSAANFALAVLSKLLRWCEDMGHRPEHSNPCRGITKYRAAKRERFLSREEFARLGQVLQDAELAHHVSLFAVAAVRLLILTGARLNEILTLQWRHVDLERQLLLLPDSKTGQKAIRLNDDAVRVLQNIPRLSGNPYVIVGQTPGEHLVNLQKPWRLLRARAGLDEVRIHDLRHSFASVAAASGASLPMIGALLGHTQPQTTARYAHLADDPLRQLNQDVGRSIVQAMGGARK